MNSFQKKPFATVFAVVFLVVFTSVIVWSACKRQIEVVRQKAEQQSFERLSSAARFLLNDSGIEFHMGRYLFNLITESFAGSSGSAEEKIQILNELLQKQSKTGAKEFSWEIFDVSLINQANPRNIEIEMVIKTASHLRSFPPEVASFLAAKLAAIITGLELSDSFNWNFKQEILPRLDERTKSDMSRFLCSSAGSFQHLMVDDSGYYQLFVPVFSPEKELDSKSGHEENRRTLKFIVSVSFDQDDFMLAADSCFINALQQNLLGVDIVFALKRMQETEEWQFPHGFTPKKGLVKLLNSEKKGEFCADGWAKIDVRLAGLENFKAVLLEKIEQSSLLLSELDRFVFVLLLFWAALLILFCGDFLLLQKTFSISLKFQLVITGFAFLLPVFLMGILTGERYFEARNADFMQQIRKIAENSVIEMDSSLKMHQAALVRNIDSAIEKAFSSASGLEWKNLGESEKKEILHNFLDMIGKTGMIMRNLMVVEKNGDVSSRLRGGSKTEERFFRELCSSIFLPVLRKLDLSGQNASLTREKDIMLKAQADEMLDAMKNMISPLFFLKMSYSPVLLNQIEGLGDRAFLFHRYLSLVNGIDSAMMMSLYPPSLDSQAMNRWVANYEEANLSGAQWLVQYKDTPGWFVRSPFKNTPKEGLMGLLRFDYDILPSKLAFFTGIGGVNPEPYVIKTSWKGKNWLITTLPGKNLIDYQISLMIPLDQHIKSAADFKLWFQSSLLAVFLICLLLGYLMASSFLLPVKNIAETANSFMAGKLSVRLPENEYDFEFAQIANEFNRVASDVESGRILRRFVSEDALRIINLEHENKFEESVQSMNAIVFFIRLADFFDFTADNKPEDAVSELNRFFSIICQEIRHSGGEINKFIGEKAMGTVFFTDQTDQYAKTLSVIRGMAGAIARYRQASGKCQIRAGISTGNVRSGIIGAEEVRLEQTVIGDTVNLAARLCSLEIKHTVLICENTAACIYSFGNEHDRIQLEKIPGQNIKGKKKTVDVYAVKG